MTKKLDTVAKLLAKAEDVAGTPEAEAFMAKAQELATTNGIDLAVARMHQASKERVQEPEERTLHVNTRNRKINRKHFIELAMAVAEVNDVEYLIGGTDRVLFMVGFPSDMEVVEALYTHLSIQMVVECDEALQRGDNKGVERVLVTERIPIAWEDRDWGTWNGRQIYDENPDDDAWRDDEESIAKVRAAYEEAIANGDRIYSAQKNNWNGGYRRPVPPPAYREQPVLDAEGNKQYVEKEVSLVDGRVFRGHFYGAFVSRMKGRLWEIKRAVMKDHGESLGESESLTLALRDKKAEVDKAHADQRAKVKHMGTYRASYEDERKYDDSGTGQRSGRKSAERVPIDHGREVKK